jgi:type II secretory pathway predicted ATPase ExeA
MYTQYYGLTDRPFQLTPDARFWFDSRTHRKAMAYLGYGLAQGEGFIVITGEVGAGKSTLVAHLMATIDRERLNAVSLVSTQVEGDDMLRLAAQGLGIATEGVEKAQLSTVRAAPRRRSAAGQAHLLIVDEAQNLPTSALEELRMLSNFTREAVRSSDFPARPARVPRPPGVDEGLEQLRQRIIASHHLDAMERNEIEAYLVHRMAVAGWNGRPAFDPAAFPAMHRPQRRHSAPRQPARQPPAPLRRRRAAGPHLSRRGRDRRRRHGRGPPAGERRASGSAQPVAGSGVAAGAR